MSRKKAGDETNRALVAYVRNLSDEELADLLVSLDPRSTKTCLSGRSGSSPGSDHQGSSHELGTLLIATPPVRGRAGQGEYVQAGCLSGYARS